MFPGVATSVTWGHISCTAIAPALRFPRFLSVQITAGNSAKPWSYLCQCCDKTTHRSSALEIPLSDSVTRGSFSPYIIMVLQPPLLQGISHHKHNWLFLLKIEPQQISYMINSVHPQDMTSPFPWTLINAFSLWLASTFYLTLIYLCSQIPRSLLALFKEIRFASLLRRMSPKSEAFSLNKIPSLYLCRPFPMPEAHPAQALLAWSSLFPSPSDSFRSFQTPALGGLCHPESPSSLLRQVGRSWGNPGAGLVLAVKWLPARLCPPCGEVTQATPGMYLILNLCAFELHCLKPYNSSQRLRYNFPLLVFIF